MHERKMIYIDACFGKKTPYTPVWMMRQAGRYLSEYKEVRKKAGDFLSLCKNPKLACKVTLQPIDILEVDAAILFSDILVVPLEMGLDLKFVSGVGPVFSKSLKTMQDIQELHVEGVSEKLSYVYETISLTRNKLQKSKALIGFCGSPWTLATYMIEGQGTKTYSKCKKMLYQNPELLHMILRKITDILKLYLEKQILSGANAVQIFDSWANALEEEAFFEFSWSYIKEISEYIKTKYPHIAVIIFPKGVSGYLDKIDGNFDVFGVDWSTPMELARDILSDKYVLQGNLEPTRLYSKEAIKKGVEKIADIMEGKRHIFNLGHGILPDIPRENAKYFVSLVKEITKR